MLTDFYKKRQEDFEGRLKEKKALDRWVSALRLTLILAAAACGYFYLQNKESVYLYLSGALLFGFVVVLFRHLKLRKLISDLKNYIQLNKHERDYLKGNLNHFDGGRHWVNGEHLFSNDLDLFGNHSLFQHTNRTVTIDGRRKLAESFLADEVNDIKLNQQAIKELSQKVDWRQEFAVGGMDVEENPGLKKALDKWLASHSYKAVLTSPILLYPLAAVTFGLLFFWFYKPTLQSFTWLSYAFMFNLFLVFSQFKNIKKEYEQLNRISKSLMLYSRLLRHIESESFESSLLLGFKKRLETGHTAASVSLQKLSKLLDGFDQMNNVVALLFTNGLYHYHLHVLRGLFHWKKNNGKGIYDWLDVVAEFDQLCSKANFAFNHSEYTYPEVLEKSGFRADEMGHPLIRSSQRVDNSISFDDFKYVILTGSNMSGKSTFLRTVGVNMVLMKMGMPVCAKRFAAYPFRLLSSMKLVDSLDKDESYFQAEVIRLKRIKDILETREPCMVLLDEILRGTNSDDKRNGTRLFMQRIADYSAIGIIATHDIDIAELAANDAGVFSAKYFESKVVAGELTFDYKLREGVCTTPNATDLMRAQGII